MTDTRAAERRSSFRPTHRRTEIDKQRGADSARTPLLA